MKKSIWIYDDSLKNINLIKKYNSDKGKIKNLYTYFASIGFSSNNLELNFDITNSWKNKNLSLFPIIDSNEGSILASLNKSKIENILEKVTFLIPKLGKIDGLHLDIEPYNSKHMIFYELVKKKTNKKITAALGKWDKEVLYFLDSAVLMNYDLSLNPKEYQSKFSSNLDKFVEDCENVNCRWSIGIPLVATHTEYTKKTDINKNRSSNGFPMKEYFLPAIEKISNYKKLPNFNGISIWAVLKKPLYFYPRFSLFPYQLDLKRLNQLDLNPPIKNQ
jgi:hypothetical protein